MEIEHLPGGSGGVWRITDAAGVTRVHRPVGPWTPAVHSLLQHLIDGGLDGVPRVFGIDDEGREVLEYLRGTTLVPDTEMSTDDALAAAASWLRRFHDLVRDYRPGRQEWRQGTQDLAEDEIICHNDPGLYNWVVQDGAFVGMIDWDRAGPGKPIDDIAFLCWSSVPLLREVPTEQAAQRLRIVAAAYGGVAPEELLHAVADRMALIDARWEAGLLRGDPGTISLRDAGVMDRHRARVAAFAARRAPIAAALAAAAAASKDTGKEPA